MKTKKIFWIFLFLLFVFDVNAQLADSTLDNRPLTISFVDATSGEPTAGAAIMVENVGAFKTDSAGKVTFPQQPNGVLKVIFKKNGYISGIYHIEIESKTILRSRIMVSPLLEDEHYRFVLSWDRQPEDLDAHFLEKRSYHISYRYTRVLNDGTAQLERDDMDGYGPESINVSLIDPESEYSFYVTKYTAKKNSSPHSLSISKATVWVYGNNRLLSVYNMPASIKGDIWYVFKIINGEIVEYNQ